jgi:hypothetical protein
MGLLDWLRDFRGDRSRYKHLPDPHVRRTPTEDPSGPHHFGRRAHRPDPNGHYGFNPEHRAKR